MTAKFSLQEGQWFMYPIDQNIPRTVNVYVGSVHSRKLVATVTRMQAIALKRWHGHEGMYYSYKNGNGRMVDVRVVGDIDAWMSEAEVAQS